MIQLSTERNGNEAIIKVEGKVDTNTAPQLDEAIQKEINEVDTLILDIKDVQYVSSAGLRVILAADQDMSDAGKSLKIKNAPEAVMDIFDMTGFTSLITFI